MNELAMFVLRATLILAAGLVVSACARRASAAWRHWILVSTALATIALPAIGAIAPGWGRVHVPSIRPTALTETAVTFDIPADGSPSAAAPPASAPLHLGAVAGVVWFTGAVLVAMPLALGYGRLRRIAARTRPAGERWHGEGERARAALGLTRQVRFLETSHPALLVSWRVRRPEILLPRGARDWGVDRIRLVVLHELAHVARGDVATLAVADLLRVVLWFHPLAWMLCRGIRSESERACDDVVLRMGGTSAARYAGELVTLARAFAGHRMPAVPAPGIGRPSTLQRRIRAMLNTSLDRRPLSGRVQVLSLAAALLLVVPVAGYGPQRAAATFSGKVTDPAGMPVPGVVIRLTSRALDLAVETKSDANGAFTIPVVPGSYDVEARRPGFKIDRIDVTVAEGEHAQRDVALDLGTLQETINVTKAPAATAHGAPSAAAPRRLESAPCSPTAAGGQIAPPMKVKHVQPIFPAAEPAAGDPVVVPLTARIATDGSVQDVVVTGEAPSDFASSAADAVRQWQFTPTLLDCTPTDVTMNVSITFRPAR
jgi:beta-lactamase regulating signal transducer with metallopeptidase domain